MCWKKKRFEEKGFHKLFKPLSVTYKIEKVATDYKSIQFQIIFTTGIFL